MGAGEALETSPISFKNFQEFSRIFLLGMSKEACSPMVAVNQRHRKRGWETELGHVPQQVTRHGLARDAASVPCSMAFCCSQPDPT